MLVWLSSPKIQTTAPSLIPGAISLALGLRLLVRMELRGCLVTQFVQPLTLLGTLNNQPSPIEVRARNRINSALRFLLRDVLGKGKSTVAAVKLLWEPKTLELPNGAEK